MANLSDKLTILRGLHSVWKNPLICDPPCCSQTLLHSCGPVLLEWLQRATMAGCNTESFLSFVRDREEVEVSSYHFFKEARHWCQSFVGNFVVAIHRRTVPTQSHLFLQVHRPFHTFQPSIYFFKSFKLVWILSNHMFKALESVSFSKHKLLLSFHNIIILT